MAEASYTEYFIIFMSSLFHVMLNLIDLEYSLENVPALSISH